MSCRHLGVLLSLTSSVMTTLTAFLYKDQPHIKIIPTKTLLRSTTLYEIITRGDILALNLTTGVFTVIPQATPVQPYEIQIQRKRVRKTAGRNSGKDHSSIQEQLVLR